MRNNDERRGVVGAFLLVLVLVAEAVAANGVPLVAAARNRDQAEVRRLLGQHTDVNVRAPDGATALLWAAHWNDLESAGLLVRAGADVNAANDFRITPLSVACTNGSAALVALLLRAGADPNTPIATGETPMLTCAGSGSADAVRMLAARGADVNATQPSQRQTALMWAAAERHPHVVDTLIRLGADLQARTRRGFTALHFAARVGDRESTRLLLAADVDVDVRARPDHLAAGRDDAASAGSTPLLVATVRGHVSLAHFLLARGADPNAGAGFTPLHWAAGTWESGVANPVHGFSDPMSGIPDRREQLRLVRALLAHGANPNQRMTQRQPGFAGGYTDTIGATPFLLASSTADVEMMRLLLDAGADPTLVTDTDTTAVMAAAGLNRPTGESPIREEQALEAVNFLLALGVDVEGVTSFGENALFGPAYRGWNTLLELLIDRGAEVNAVSVAGITPWLAASGLGDRLGGVLFNTEGAALLVEHGADPGLGTPCQAQNKCR